MTAPRRLTLFRLVKDVVCLLGLAGALALVHMTETFGLQWWLHWNGSVAAPIVSPTPEDDSESGDEENATAASRPPRISITPSEFDEVDTLLDSLGPAFRYRELQVQDLRDASILAQCDVIFLGCGELPESWRVGSPAVGERNNPDAVGPNPEVPQRVATNLREFVANGGTLYAPDRWYQTIATAFPEFVDAQGEVNRQSQRVNAKVVSPDLRGVVGLTIGLRFDGPSWRVAALANERCQVLLKGETKGAMGSTLEAPLAVQFRHQEGNVIFTSFRLGVQDAKVQQGLVRFFVFRALAAHAEVALAERLFAEGLSPQRSSVFSISAAQSQTRRFFCSKAGPLSFLLAFRNDQQARLRLTVEDPHGKQFQEEGSGIVEIKIPDGAMGEWRCTVTGLKVPYESFLCTLAMGAGQDGDSL